MSIKYEIHTIQNSQGTGKERHYAHIFDHVPMSANVLEQKIQDSCTLKKGDVQAALITLREYMIQELSHGNRFHIPEIGYFSLSVDLNMPDDKPIEKVRADYLSVRKIKFRPEASLIKEVKQNVRFERATYTSKSRQYTEEMLWPQIQAFLAENSCITRRDMEQTFGLRQNAALKWLKHFTDVGLLKKEGAKSAPVYFEVKM